MKIKIHRNVSRVDLERLKISGQYDEGQVIDLETSLAMKLVNANLATPVEKPGKAEQSNAA